METRVMQEDVEAPVNEAPPDFRMGAFRDVRGFGGETGAREPRSAREGEEVAAGEWRHTLPQTYIGIGRVESAGGFFRQAVALRQAHSRRESVGRTARFRALIPPCAGSSS